MSNKNVLAEVLDEIKNEAETALSAFENVVHSVGDALKPILESDLAAFIQKFKTLAVNLIVNVVKAGISMVEAKSISITGVLQAAQAAGQSFASDLYAMTVALVEQVAVSIALVLGQKVTGAVVA
jgi:hypothetical protein